MMSLPLSAPVPSAGSFQLIKNKKNLKMQRFHQSIPKLIGSHCLFPMKRSGRSSRQTAIYCDKRMCVTAIHVIERDLFSPIHNTSWSKLCWLWSNEGRRERASRRAWAATGWSLMHYLEMYSRPHQAHQNHTPTKWHFQSISNFPFFMGNYDVA